MSTTVVIRPGKLTRAVTPPPSKSQAHRLIIAAALAQGESRLENVDLSQDIRATLGCMETLLDKYHLPKTTDKSIDELLEAAHADKKRRGDAITLIQPDRLGSCILHKTDYSELAQVLDLGMEL